MQCYTAVQCTAAISWIFIDCVISGCICFTLLLCIFSWLGSSVPTLGRRRHSLTQCQEKVNSKIPMGKIAEIKSVWHFPYMATKLGRATKQHIFGLQEEASEKIKQEETKVPVNLLNCQIYFFPYFQIFSL